MSKTRLYDSVGSKVALLVGVSLLFQGVAGSQPGSGSAHNTPRQELIPPLQDLEEIEGEIVWLQGTLLRADPTPYRSVLGPLATPEQGLLDDDGELWTFLDNPKGRELRYNPALRGQRVIVKGWKHPKSKIFEVYSWEDSKHHPVRVREDYPEPERIPFEPDKAATIESIPPVPPSKIDEKKLDTDLWEIREGTDLLPTPGEKPAVEVPKSSADVEEIQRLLQEASPEDATGTPQTSTPKTVPKVDLTGKKHSASPSIENSTPQTETKQKSQAGLTQKSVAPPVEQRVLNEEGQPVASPEEIDQALLKSLTE